MQDIRLSQTPSTSYGGKPVLLYVITKSDIGGAQGNVLDLIKAFRNSYEVHLAVGIRGPLSEDVEALGVPVHILSRLTRNIKLTGDLACIKDCMALIRRINPVVIHAHSSKAGVVARVAGWRCGVPTVFTAHGWGFSPGTPKLRRFVAFVVERLLSTISTKIICVSESDRQQALKLGVGNRRKLATVRYGIYNTTVPQANPGLEPVKMIMVARFNEQKDQATLLRAIARLKHHSLHLNLAGSGPSFETCKALAVELGISDRLSFLGDRRDVPELLQQSQVFILSTHYEGLPISILEAMRCGLPVIGSSVNGIPEEVEQGQTGFVVPPRDPEALAKALDRILSSSELRISMGIAAKAKFEREFTIDRMTDETQMIYAEVSKVKAAH
jgi:glycosyltransferase involved in cell wall biosynthesis